MTSERGLARVFMLFVVATLAACGGGDEAPPANSASVTAVIGPAGGTLTGPDGVQVVVPPGALDRPTAIGIARSAAGAPAPLQEGNAPAGPVYEFTPHDLVFNVPVTIRMPVPANGVGLEVFMASLNADWQVNDARLVNGFAEWQRNSFSFGIIGMVCFIPTGSTDPYPCTYPRGYATASATLPGVITQVAFGNWQQSAGSWVVNQAGPVSLTLNYSAAPDCSDTNGSSPSGHVKLIRWNPAVPLNTPGRVTTLLDQSVTLNQVQVTPPAGTFAYPGGGPVFRGVGSTSVDVSAYLTDATNVFGFSFTCRRPGRSMSGGGDLITIIGPMPAPVGIHTIGGTVSGLTGAGLVLRNNGGNDLPVSADGPFTFSTAVVSGGAYAVTVFTQPSGQSCTVANNGSGTANANVTNVTVSCVTVSAAPAWQGSALLENIDQGSATEPQIAFDANGNGMAIWIQDDGTNLRIQSRRYTPNGGWGSMMPVDNGGAMALSPKIAVDGSGNVRAVWLQFVTTSTRSIWTNVYSPVSGWGTATVLEASVSSVGGNKPEIAMDPAGNATVVWYAFDGAWTNLWARRYTAGGAWDTATLIENDNNGGVSDQGVVMEANGNAMVVWTQRTNVLANRYVGSGWGTPTPIETSDLNAQVSDIALDGAGNIMVVFHQQTSAASLFISSIYTNRFSNGSWGTAALVKSAIPYFPQSAIAMNASGNAMLVWLEDDGFDTGSIWARAYTAAGVGGATVRIDNLSTFTNGRTPQVAMDASGNAVAVWGQGSHIWSARYVAGTGWGTPANIDNVAGGGPSNGPQVAVDSNSNALAVWERSNGTVQNIWANVFR